MRVALSPLSGELTEQGVGCGMTPLSKPHLRDPGFRFFFCVVIFLFVCGTYVLCVRVDRARVVDACVLKEADGVGSTTAGHIYLLECAVFLCCFESP